MPTYETYMKLAKEGGKHAKLFTGMAAWAHEQLLSSPLTEGEKDVARMVRAGHSRASIAYELNVSQPAISKRFSSIRSKIGASPNATDANLVYVLVERGWLP